MAYGLFSLNLPGISPPGPDAARLLQQLVTPACILPVPESLCSLLQLGVSQLSNASVRKHLLRFSRDDIWQQLKALEIRSSEPFASRIASIYPKEQSLAVWSKDANSSQQLSAKPGVLGVIKPRCLARALDPSPALWIVFVALKQIFLHGFHFLRYREVKVTASGVTLGEFVACWPPAGGLSSVVKAS